MKWVHLRTISLQLFQCGKVCFSFFFILYTKSHRIYTILDINLTELQKTLDAQGIEIVENQKESVVGRKALADRTKGMKA